MYLCLFWSIFTLLCNFLTNQKMFSFFVAFCLSAVLGVDIGAEQLRAAIIRKGQNIEILHGHESEDSFPTVLTVMPKEGEVPDIINESDINKFDFYFNNQKYIRNYPNNTIRYASTLIAKLPTPEFTTLTKSRRLWGEPSLYYDDRILISGLMPEIVIYRALNRINQSVINLDPQAKTDSLTIVVPKFYPQGERDSLAVMAKDLGFKPYIADCTKAAGYWYSLHYGTRIGKKKEKVMFVFFGASNFQISLLEFRKKGQESFIKELEYSFNDTIGGRDIDVLVADMLAQKYNKQITPKIEQILLQEAKKIKEKLTILDKVSGNIENIDENVDFGYTVTKKEFNHLIQPIINIMKNVTSRMKKHPDKVFLLGGCSRIPIIQSVLKTSLNVTTLYTAMSKDEQLSFAGAIISASMNSQYLLPPINYTSLPIYSMSIRSSNGTVPFEGASLVPGERYWVTQSADLYPFGSSIYMIWNQATHNTSFTQKKDGRWRFLSPQGKMFHRWKYQLRLTGRRILKMEDDKLELQKTVNSMEQLLLQTREVLANSINYTTEKERNLLSKAANITNRWFLNQKTYNITTLKYRYKLLDDAVCSVFSRYQNVQLLPNAIQNLTEACETARDLVKKWSTLSKSRRPPRADFRNLLKYVVEAEMWLDEKRRIQRGVGQFEQPQLTWIGVRSKTEKILKFANDMATELQNGGSQQQQQQQMKKEKSKVYVYPPNSAKVNYNDS